MKKSSLRATAALQALSILGAGMLFAAPLSAQTTAQTPVAGTAEPAEIIVTGTRILRPDLTSSVPVAVIGKEAFDQRGIENIADLLSQQPQFAPSFGTSRTQSNFSGAASSGLNTLNLRNLGGNRTLTIMNGRRMASGTTTAETVDFNTIPTANISRIDVITGGASATYGADAVAGVINIITDKSLRGFEVGASYGIAERGYNANPNAYIRFGSSLGDGGHVQLTGQYDRQGLVLCAQLEICNQDVSYFPPGAPLIGPGAQSAVAPQGTFFLVGANGLPAVSATAANGSFTDANGNLIPFSAALHGFNRNATRSIAIPIERYLFAAEAEFPISDALKPFFEFNYGRSETKGSFEAHPFQSDRPGSLFGGGPGVAGLQASIPLTIQQTAGGVTTTIANPIIPTAIYNAAVARGQTTLTWQQRLSFAPRGATNKRTMTRFAGGIRGRYQPFADKNWNYEVSYVNGRNRIDGLTDGLVSTRQLYFGLRTELVNGTLQCADAGARGSGCVPINPFDGYNATEQTALITSAGQRGVAQLHDVLAYTSGELFRLPGGPLSVAFGGEYRSFSGFLDYDDPINLAQTTGNQISDVRKIKTTTKELFVEGVAPVLGDMRFVHRLTVEGAFRRSWPSRGRHYDTWRYGGTFEPIRNLKFRAVRARAARSPAPGELDGIGQTFGVVNDPCIDEPGSLRQTNATVATNCLAAGVPLGYNPPLNVRQAVAGTTGGNPNLTPEFATTLTYGVAWEPHFIPGLSLTADRFDIKIKDLIFPIERQAIANRCYSLGTLCDAVTRGTNPNVPGANYVLTAVNEQTFNIAEEAAKGYDFSVRYGRPLFAGRFTLNAAATHYDKVTFTNLPGDTPLDLLGFAGGSTTIQGFIRWAGNLNLNWRARSGLNFNYNLRYVGKAKNSPYAALPIQIPAYDYHNARFGLDLKRYEFFVGVENIFDTKPPLFPTNTSGTQALDTIPAYYDIFGRSFYAGFKIRI